MDNSVTNNLTSIEKKTVLDSVSIPTANDNKGLGNSLPVVLDNNTVKEVSVVVNNVEYNFLDFIIEKSKYIRNNHMDQIVSFDKYYKFYYIKGNKDYILAVKDLGNSLVDKLQYSTDGVLINRIRDSFSDTSSLLVRTNGLQKVYIDNNVVLKKKNYIKFNALENIKLKNEYWLANPNIGVVDIETYVGKALPVGLDYENFINEVIVVIKGLKCNFIDIIRDKIKYIKSNHKDNIKKFDSDYKFYYIKSNFDYILVVKQLGNGNVEKLKYSLNGVLISRVIDHFSDEFLIRTTGSHTMYIDNKKVVTKVENSIKFNNIVSKPIQFCTKGYTELLQFCPQLWKVS